MSAHRLGKCRGPPTTAPVGHVDPPQHTVHFSDAATATRKAKPVVVRGCEIWMKLGTSVRGGNVGQ
ncbi:MAG: hypothetical protein L0211_12820 [Planctomycetaceae bacterium]|nr:hypothetical protein [Planctomycetaceae bacterium]